MRKWWKLSFCKRQIRVEKGLGSYFADLLDDAPHIARYIEAHIRSPLLEKVNAYDFTDCVAVHVRLGDYPEHVRIPISWYKERVQEMAQAHPAYRFCLFSDGSDEELAELMRMDNVRRVFFGNAIADIIAISRCCYLIGSDSTFSGWGAFLGQVPCRFYSKHYGPVLKDSSKEIVENP